MTYPASPLESLVGTTVTRAEDAHDYIQLTFGTETGMSIFNDWHLVPETLSLRDLIGQAVTAVHSSPDAISITLGDGGRLFVDLSSGAWHGPEAIQLDRAGFPTVIWN